MQGSRTTQESARIYCILGDIKIFWSRSRLGSRGHTLKQQQRIPYFWGWFFNKGTRHRECIHGLCKWSDCWSAGGGAQMWSPVGCGSGKPKKIIFKIYHKQQNLFQVVSCTLRPTTRKASSTMQHAAATTAMLPFLSVSSVWVLIISSKLWTNRSRPYFHHHQASSPPPPWWRKVAAKTSSAAKVIRRSWRDEVESSCT